MRRTDMHSDAVPILRFETDDARFGIGIVVDNEQKLPSVCGKHSSKAGVVMEIEVSVTEISAAQLFARLHIIDQKLSGCAHHKQQ